MIKPYVRDSSYFRIVRNSKRLLTGAVIDREFNHLINFFNNKLAVEIDNLLNKTVIGQVDSEGYLLRNIGKGLTEFSRIRNSDIPEKSINFDRFRKLTPNSILYSNDDLTELNCDMVNKTLIGNLASSKFDYIGDANIQESSIPNSKIATKTIDIDLLSDDIDFNNLNIVYNSIKAMDNIFTGYHISDKAYTYSKITFALEGLRDDGNLDFVRSDITGIAEDIHIIKNRHIKNNSIEFDVMFSGERVLSNQNIPLNAFRLPVKGDISPYKIFNAANLLTLNNIKNNSFTPRNNKANLGIPYEKFNDAIKAKLKIGGLSA